MTSTRSRSLVAAALGIAIAAATIVPSTFAAPKPGKVITTSDGLKYQDIVVGKGASPKVGQLVTVSYVGKLTDGTIFDASANHPPGTFQFTIGEGQVIKGWDEGVLSMKVGGDRKLIIPPALGYGPSGQGAIPPNSTLIFDVKLKAIQ